MEFAQLISQTDVALFRAKIGTYLDVDQFLRFIAVNAFIVNTDSYLRGGHNFYIYLDPKDDKFRFIPWDQDLSMGGRAGGGGACASTSAPFNGDQPLIYWLLDDPAVAARYRAIVRELGTTAFTAAELTKLIDALEKVGTGRGPSPRAFIATGPPTFSSSSRAGIGSRRACTAPDFVQPVQHDPGRRRDIQ